MATQNKKCRLIELAKSTVERLFITMAIQQEVGLSLVIVELVASIQELHMVLVPGLCNDDDIAGEDNTEAKDTKDHQPTKEVTFQGLASYEY